MPRLAAQWGTRATMACYLLRQPISLFYSSNFQNALFILWASICLAVSLIHWSYFCWLRLLSITISWAEIEQLLNTSHMLLLFIVKNCKSLSLEHLRHILVSLLFTVVNKFTSVAFPQMTHFPTLDYFWTQERGQNLFWATQPLLRFLIQGGKYRII